MRSFLDTGLARKLIFFSGDNEALEALDDKGGFPDEWYTKAYLQPTEYVSLHLLPLITYINTLVNAEADAILFGGGPSEYEVKQYFFKSFISYNYEVRFKDHPALRTVGQFYRSYQPTINDDQHLPPEEEKYTVSQILAKNFNIVEPHKDMHLLKLSGDQKTWSEGVAAQYGTVIKIIEGALDAASQHEMMEDMHRLASRQDDPDEVWQQLDNILDPFFAFASRVKDLRYAQNR
jgi:hypothetical protein